MKRTALANESSKSKTSPRLADSGELLTCLQSYGISLTAGKQYRVIPDPHKEAHGLVRIVDDTGEDYVYLRSSFE